MSKSKSTAQRSHAKLEGIEALSFDLFDTLVDQDLSRLPSVEWGEKRIPSTAHAIYERVAAMHDIEMGRFFELLQEVDRDLREPRFAQGREFPTQERFEEVLRRVIRSAGASSGPIDAAQPGNLVELASELTEIHMSGIERCTSYRSHHAEVLARLHAKRPIALCSNFSHSPTALSVLEQAGLLAHFDVLIVSDAVDSRKPFRPIFEAVLNGLGVAPASVLHVGDRLRADVQGPAALGIRTAWITRCVKDRDAALAKHKGPLPDLEIEDIAELEELLA